jgi:hypothetical protein
VVTAALACSLLLACTPSARAVRADADAYLEQMQRWAPLQASTAQALERILATQFVDDPAVLHEIEDSRARILAHLAVARAYRPRTEPVRALHARYIAAWEGLLRGYAAIEDGLARTDASQLSAGRAAFAQWRDAMIDVARGLQALTSRPK